MPVFRAFVSGLKTLFRKRESNEELSDELNAFLEAAAAEKMKSGLTYQQALREARLELGTVESAREHVRSAGWEFRFDTLGQDLRFAGRMLAKSPGFTAVAILTLALGIGANTAIFSVISAALMRALPIADAQHLYLLMWNAPKEPEHSSYSSYGDCENHRIQGNAGCTFAQPMLATIREHNTVFSSFAAFAGASTLDLSGFGSATTTDRAEYVSGDYFQTLGIRPFAGRLISAADDAPSASPVAVLSYNFWQSNFGGSPSVVGSSIHLNKVPFVVVGIAEPKFDALSLGNSIQLWLPISSAPRLKTPWDNREVDSHYWWLVSVARLKPGVNPRQARDEVNAIFRNQVFDGPLPVWTKNDNPSLTLVPAQQGLNGQAEEVSAPLLVLMAAVGVVLLIACANVAGLLLARVAARRKEFALRSALGAGRWRLLRQLLTESVLLSLAGGALGLLIANWANAAIMSFVASSSEDPAPFTAVIDTRVLIFTAVASALTGILFGIAPAIRSLRVDLTPALKDPSGDTPHSAAPRARWFNPGNVLAVAQISLTIVVLVVAGLLVRSLQSLRTLNPGFDTRNVLTFNLDPTLIGYKSAAIDNFYRDLRDRIRAVPGVISVSYSWRSLLGNGLWTTSFLLPGHAKGDEAHADVLPVGPDFFSTMRMRFQLGREFNSTDYAVSSRIDTALDAQYAQTRARIKSGTPGDPKIDQAAAALPPLPAIVNESFVKKYFSDKSPLGARFGQHAYTSEEPNTNPGWEIVGVVSDAKYNSLRRPIEPTMYTPSTGGTVSFAVRTTGTPSAIVPQIRAIVGQMDADLPLSRVRTITQQIEYQLIAERLVARLSSFFGLLALLLACIGLYGLLAYEVTRRTREIGIRIALGADRTSVLRLVVGQGLALAAVGAAVGIAAAFGLTRFLSTLLYGVRPTDPVTFIVVAALLGAVAALACYLPARRAMRVDPLVALRYE